MPENPRFSKSAQKRLAEIDQPEQEIFRNLRSTLIDVFRREGSDYADWSGTQIAAKVADYWEKYIPVGEQKVDLDPRGTVFRVVLKLGDVVKQMKMGEESLQFDERGHLEADLIILIRTMNQIDNNYFTD